MLKNDLEEFSFSRYPELKKIKEYLYKIGAIYVSMTGSGSSVYGIFLNNENSSLKLNFLKEDYFFWKEILD